MTIEDKEFKPMVYEIKSDSNPLSIYFVTHYGPQLFRCTCKDYLYRSHNKEGYSTGHKCKHILGVIKKNGVA